MPNFRRFKSQKFAALFLGASALWLIYTIVRSKILLDNGRIIEQHSASFARDVFVGDQRTGAADAPLTTLLAMGDSTAAGWGADALETTYPYQIAQALAGRGARVHLVNVAVGGATAGDVAAAQIAAIKREEPDVITLSVGANDATHFTDLGDYRRDLSTILAAIKISNARTILVADTPDMFLAPALPLPLAWATARRARAQNAVLRALTKGSRAQIVELYARGKLRADELYAADRFHPSNLGYARWARLFIQKL